MSGVKGRSGRKPAYEALNTHELLKLAEASLRKYFLDPAMPLQNKAALAAMLYAKAIKQTSEQTLRILHESDLAILSKYDALPDDKLKQLAQAQPIDIDAVPCTPMVQIRQDSVGET